jgi:hypothetical protein
MSWVPSFLVALDGDCDAHREHQGRVPGRRIAHVRGLWQGDPLSPQQFVLAMEVITKLFCRAANQGYLTPIGNCTSVQQISFYANDVVLFFKQKVTDLVTV